MGRFMTFPNDGRPYRGSTYNVMSAFEPREEGETGAVSGRAEG